MKKVTIVSIVFLILWLIWSLLSSCGSWIPFGREYQKPKCFCLGKIIQTGGPTTSVVSTNDSGVKTIILDDSGGRFYCIGLKIPKF